ncbi:carbohydrate kinase [Paracoccus caeni]|uniref:Carbohydrate kinase n=1 Tax=Paracoccus caeni TaxID=657651 RepID=A0A934SB03_9RHOB|nr:carbohydrate kinase [Paracoccus caeni]MBK4215481.1 carbohydrate kinase [Paracoccus caeni]
MILCTGESLIDMVPENGAYRPLAGGAVYNTTVALGRLGEETGYLWPLSRDPFGEQLIAPLAEAGVNIDLCPRTDRLTTLAMVTLENGHAKYFFYDEGSAGRMFAEDDIAALPANVTALFAGGISLVPDPCGATVEKLIADNHDRIPVILDPNIRPFFISDADAYHARLKRLLAMSDIVKLSSDDIDWLYPGLSTAAAAQEVLNSGAKIVLHTSGEEGATAYWSGEPVSVAANRATVVDTIGAGDTFNAGVMASLRQQGVLTKDGLAALTPEQLREALAYGAKVAAIVVARAGANPPWARELV